MSGSTWVSDGSCPNFVFFREPSVLASDRPTSRSTVRRHPPLRSHCGTTWHPGCSSAPPCLRRRSSRFSGMRYSIPCVDGQKCKHIPASTLLQRHATNNVWEAPWWAGLCSGLKGGFTTLTAFQALERTLKSCLPSNFHLLSIQDVSERIERLCSTCCRLQGSAATEQFLRGSPMLGSPLQANYHYAAS